MSMLAVAERPAVRLDGEPSLAAVVGALWEELQAGRPVACPVCHGDMHPRYAQQALASAGRCEECGSSLS
jgi:DNA-directed RNA polymerase subunit RPC12/RpoP